MKRASTYNAQRIADSVVANVSLCAAAPRWITQASRAQNKTSGRLEFSFVPLYSSKFLLPHISSLPLELDLLMGLKSFRAMLSECVYDGIKSPADTATAKDAA